MRSHRAIILLQYLESKEAFPFASPLLTFLEHRKGQNDVIFSVDNLSDSLTVHYAKRLMDESGEVLIVCDLQEAKEFGALLPVLNYGMKKQQVKLISVDDTLALKPFLIARGGKVINDLEELEGHL